MYVTGFAAYENGDEHMWN